VTGCLVARRHVGATAAMACVGGALTMTLTAGPVAAGPRPEVSDQALAEAVVDLSSDAAVVDLVVTSERTDGSVTDSVRAGRRTVTLAADVLFGFGSAELTGQAGGRLEEAAAAARGGGPVTVTG
jgi:outer membrane protein OmpA-like peptidoglycan-associated protein